MATVAIPLLLLIMHGVYAPAGLWEGYSLGALLYANEITSRCM